MSFNFKALREDLLKYTQEEMAEMFDENILKIKSWDEGEEPSLSIIRKIAEKTGLSFNEIMDYKGSKPNSISIKNTWKGVNDRKRIVTNYMKEELEKMDVSDEYKERYIQGLKEGIKRFIKPSVSIVGRSDTGKSTMINALIGVEKMPTSWTPTTSIAVYIKHIDDRPDFIKEEVWIFADKVGKEFLWDVKKLYDKQYCERWKIAQGDVGVLRQFGTRQEGKPIKNAGSAVIFIDSPILKNCDIIDLPGFGTEEQSDDDITFKTSQNTDLLIYLSQANGFMRGEDSTYLKENIRNLPVFEKKDENDLEPLCNIFIVASQAHAVTHGNVKQLEGILKSGYERFRKSCSEEYWSTREDISGYSDMGSFLQNRFYTYTTDIESLRTEFEKSLQRVLEKLPEIIDLKVKEFIHGYIK